MIMLQIVMRLQRISMDPVLLQILRIDPRRPQEYHELLDKLNIHLMAATLLMLERPWRNETPDQQARREAVAIEFREAACELNMPATPEDGSHARESRAAKFLEEHCNKMSKLEQMFSTTLQQALRTRNMDAVIAAFAEMLTPYEMAAVSCVQALGVRRRGEERVLHILQREMHALSTAVIEQVQAPPLTMWQRAWEWVERGWRRLRYGRQWKEREAEEILSTFLE